MAPFVGDALIILGLARQHDAALVEKIVYLDRLEVLRLKEFNDRGRWCSVCDERTSSARWSMLITPMVQHNKMRNVMDYLDSSDAGVRCQRTTLLMSAPIRPTVFSVVYVEMQQKRDSYYYSAEYFMLQCDNLMKSWKFKDLVGIFATRNLQISAIPINFARIYGNLVR